ncbi:MAG TPA: hypothetical protein VMV69_12685, partial [Pirellulales bacterium]|nr:hypothetical protein [Pirellulales bacterium]
RVGRPSRQVLVSGRDGQQAGLWLTRGIASAAADHGRRWIGRSALRAGSTFRRPAMLVTTTLRRRIRSHLGLGRRPAMRFAYLTVVVAWPALARIGWMDGCLLLPHDKQTGGH